MSNDVVVIDNKKPKYTPKSKNWATEVYRDNPVDIGSVINYLTSHFVSFAVSPLHDKDTYDNDNPELGHKKGEFKKPHYHILMIFDCPKTRKQLEPIVMECPCVGLELVGNRRLYYEYLVHKNEMFKYHYKEPPQCFNCVVADFYGDEYLLNDIVNDIISNDIVSLGELITFYKVNNYDMVNIMKVIRKNAYFLKQLLKEKENHYF